MLKATHSLAAPHRKRTAKLTVPLLLVLFEQLNYFWSESHQTLMVQTSGLRFQQFLPSVSLTYDMSAPGT